MLTLLTLADEIDNAMKDTNVNIRNISMNDVLSKVRESVASLGYAYAFAVDVVSTIITMQQRIMCRNKLMFDEDIEYARKVSDICRFVYNRETE